MFKLSSRAPILTHNTGDFIFKQNFCAIGFAKVVDPHNVNELNLNQNKNQNPLRKPSRYVSQFTERLKLKIVSSICILSFLRSLGYIKSCEQFSVKSLSKRSA